MSDIHRKIAALLAKTTGNGCTEAEAMSAAEAAARLMREHGLSDADIEMSSALSDGATRRATWRDHLSGVIGFCTNSAPIHFPPEEVVFYGISPGPEIAAYLRDICIRAVENEAKRFRASALYRRKRTTATRHQASVEFIGGMVNRIEVRLLAMFKATMDDKRLAAATDFAMSRWNGKGEIFEKEIPRLKSRRSGRRGQSTWLEAKFRSTTASTVALPRPAF